MIDVRINRFEHKNQISGVFQFKGRWYLADLIELQWGQDIYETPYEFMVFESDEQGNITSWAGEFVLRPDAVSEEILLRCIEEFCAFHSETPFV